MVYLEPLLCLLFFVVLAFLLNPLEMLLSNVNEGISATV